MNRLHAFRPALRPDSITCPTRPTRVGVALRALGAACVAVVAPSCAYWFDAGASGATPSSAPSTSGANANTNANDDVAHSLRLRGSATIGATLAPKLALGFLHQLGAADATQTWNDEAHNRMAFAGHAGGALYTVQLEYAGSGTAFDGLASGACDVGLSSRPIAGPEAERLAALGDMTSATNEHVVAMDGIAVVVNKSSRVAKLSTAQIAKIWRGEARDWSSFGGAPGEIHVYSRDKRSGTYDTFVQLALGGKDPAARATVLDDNAAIEAAVAKDDAGIGFVALPYVKETKPVAVQDGESSVAIVPTPVTVGTEEYPLSRRLFLYTAERPSTPLATRFVEYAMSEEGQRHVGQTGFVSLDVRGAPAALADGAPADYAKAIAGLQRVSFNVRFRESGAKVALDPKSVRDVQRLARFVRASSSTHAVSLFAFTDDRAGEAKSVDLSRQRAKAVAELLKGQGIATKNVEGFGAALPVGSNETKEGRQRNNRVEVWVE